MEKEKNLEEMLMHMKATKGGWMQGGKTILKRHQSACHAISVL